jgi:hypothetical protein
MGRVIIGMDPHKRSATIEIIDDRETVLAAGRFGTDRDGYTSAFQDHDHISVWRCVGFGLSVVLG